MCLQEPSALEQAAGVDFTVFGAPVFAEMPEHQDVGKEIEIERPLIIVGALRDSERELVLGFLRRQKSPLYAEVISQLRGEESLSGRMLSLSDAQMREACLSGEFKSILRIGGVPTTRLWRDLEGALANFPVISVSNAAWSGLSKARRTREPFRHWNSLAPLSRLKITGFRDGDIAKAVGGVLSSPHESHEESLLRTLSDRLLGQNIYLGNSLPIREWDRVARGPYRRVEANRGANGIDGQVSTFLGWSEGEAGSGEFWGVVGDLTALYDLQSLWVTPQLTKLPRRLVVIHNSGGRIFEKMFRHPAFLNEHQLDFSHWARMFGWAFESWTEIPANLERSELNLLIELRV
jgi:2-succinyl-5-enolpyruvyl-6-hydroxy-3-cyclohexene-1-carboxylate synthase